MRNFLLLICLSLFTGLNAQEFYHFSGFGLNYSKYSKDYLPINPTVPNPQVITEDNNSFFYGLSYGFKLSYLRRPKLTYAIGTYPLAGISFTAFNNQSFIDLGLDIPVYGEIILGDRDLNNFTAGLGVDFNYYYANYLLTNEIVVGPSVMLATQLRFNDRVFFLKTSFTYGLNNGRSEYEGFRVVGGDRHSFNISLIYPLSL